VGKNQNSSKKPLAHVAIIMDGNGRWAKQKGLPRIQGHRAGVENLRKILDAVKELKIPYLTVYSFSTENWLRPKEEVKGLMKLLDLFLKKYTKDLIKSKVRLRVIGDYNKLPNLTVKHLEAVMDATKDFSENNLTLALNYSARHEVIGAIKRCYDEMDKESVESLDWNRLSSFLDTKDLPDPDLIIRTSGECRLSNFLLLQGAYAEIYFTPVLWPDFKKEHLEKAIEFYNARERRFGMTSEQINKETHNPVIS